MKVDINVKLEYENAEDLNTEHKLSAIVHPGLSITQNAEVVSDALAEYINKEIFHTLDTMIRRDIEHGT